MKTILGFCQQSEAAVNTAALFFARIKTKEETRRIEELKAQLTKDITTGIE